MQLLLGPSLPVKYPRLSAPFSQWFSFKYLKAQFIHFFRLKKAPIRATENSIQLLSWEEWYSECWVK